MTLSGSMVLEDVEDVLVLQFNSYGFLTQTNVKDTEFLTVQKEKSTSSDF